MREQASDQRGSRTLKVEMTAKSKGQENGEWIRCFFSPVQGDGGANDVKNAHRRDIKSNSKRQAVDVSEREREREREKSTFTKPVIVRVKVCLRVIQA